MTDNKQRDLMQFGFGTEMMKYIKVCGACGAKSDSNQQFCCECGAQLPSETLYDTYKKSCCVCPICDTIVAKDTGYCPRCGGKIEQQTF